MCSNQMQNRCRTLSQRWLCKMYVFWGKWSQHFTGRSKPDMAPKYRLAKEKKSIITTTNLTIAQNDFLWVDAVQGRYDVPALLALLGWWVFWTQNRSSLCQLLDFLWDSKQGYRETMWRKKWRDLWTVSARVSASSDFLIQPSLLLIATLKW